MAGTQKTGTASNPKPRTASNPEPGTARKVARLVTYTAPESFQPLASYQTLVRRVVDAFGDELKASRWLSLPNADLDNQTPLQVAQRDNYSTVPLEPILVRIEHGIDY
jgi:uncharacterized protein (DUF2384 family)